MNPSVLPTHADWRQLGFRPNDDRVFRGEPPGDEGTVAWLGATLPCQKDHRGRRPLQRGRRDGRAAAQARSAETPTRRLIADKLSEGRSYSALVVLVLRVLRRLRQRVVRWFQRR